MPVTFVCVWFVLAALAGPQCWAQSLAPRVPAQPARPIDGPATVDLGNVAQIEVPDGYCFLNAGLARDVLMREGNLVSRDLVGMIRPISPRDNRGIVFGFTPVGFVKVLPNESIDQEAGLAFQREIVLKQNRMLRRLGNATYEKDVEWETAPAYDPATGTVEWSLRAESTKGDKLINHTRRMLGRRGVLDAVFMLPAQKQERLAEMRTIADTIRFKKGESRADFAEGDAMAAVTLAGILQIDTGYLDTSTDAAPLPESGRTWLYLLIGIGVACFGGTAMIVVKLRRAKNQGGIHPSPPRHAASSNAITTFVPAHVGEAPKVTAPAAQSVSAGLQPQKRAPLVLSPKPLDAAAGRKAARTNGRHRGRNDKRRLFDYNRYFADLMSSVSGHLAYEDGIHVPRGNGDANPANGNGNGSGNGSDTVTSHTSVNTAEIQAQVIATQKSLLEEQRRLIQEQSKIIEEKTRLIAEKNRILDRQAELFDPKLM